MVTFNQSYTLPINPPSLPPSEPVLSLSNVWQLLLHKVHNGQIFSPVISSTTILSPLSASSSSSGDQQSVPQLTRKLTFHPNTHPAGLSETVEVVKFYEPCKIEFHGQDDGKNLITIIISVGEKEEEAELYYTYVFNWRHEGVKEGSEEAKKLEEGDWMTTKTAVKSTIETMRRLVREGQVKLK